MSVITQNEKKLLRSLLTKKGRTAHQQFLAEGIRLLEESVKHNLAPQKVYFAAHEISPRANLLVKKFTRLGIPIQSMSMREMAQIADTTTNQGIIGLFNIDQIIMNGIEKSEAAAILLLDNISDPGNAGTLFRSALAFEFNTVAVTSGTVDIFNPKVVRSSAGAIFGLRISEVTTDLLIRIKRDEKFFLIAADIKGNSCCDGLKKFDLMNPIILAVGGEAEGLSSEILKLADMRMKIEHSERVESLNAAVAGSIMMRELYQLKIGSKGK